MSKKWSKEDRNSFNNSEVMREFEKLILTRAQQIGQIHEKIANVEKINAITDATNKANEAALKLKETVSNMADDPLPGEVSEIEINPRKKDINIDIIEDFSEDEELGKDEAGVGMDDVVANSIINELNILAKKASDSGDYISLYEIERTIQQIKDSEDDI